MRKNVRKVAPSESKLLGEQAGFLGLNKGREPARQTGEPGSNPSWDATVHPVFETFNVMRVV